MKAVRVVEGKKQFVSQEIERPSLPAGAVRVRIQAAFLPPYFEHLPSGNWRTPPRPFTPGQCAIGVVEETSDPDCPLRPGQLVYCDMYIEGPGAEADHGFIGCFGLTPAASRHLAKWPNGTFAEEFVGPEHCFTLVPEGIDMAPEILCRLGWFATALAGFRRGGFRPGTVVAINGAAGLLGTSAALVALAIGAAEVRLVGRRAAVLHELSALDRRIVVEGADDQTPLDFVLDCAGGDNTWTSMSLLERLRRFGSITFVGALNAPAPFDTSALMRNSKSVVGSFWFPHQTAADVLALIVSGAIDPSVFRAETFGTDQILAAMKQSVQHSGGLAHIALKP
ncbi:Zinc-containing alcohol dehydrogenase superfamily protein [Mesorhizobium plurifarium]|uniref:Zinc-containing alcohol dehydrogenase superfamily protein n=1 Tax=Mesorhizobium plurifarium TaxID=69974 RepID=A0A0K2VTF1_MESPL|nr:Zinc-containing alcohol dehydrogenase superfamily protein [Mesorhizobium plurifarium]